MQCVPSFRKYSIFQVSSPTQLRASSTLATQSNLGSTVLCIGAHNISSSMIRLIYITPLLSCIVIVSQHLHYRITNSSEHSLHTDTFKIILPYALIVIRSTDKCFYLSSINFTNMAWSFQNRTRSLESQHMDRQQTYTLHVASINMRKASDACITIHNRSPFFNYSNMDQMLRDLHPRPTRLLIRTNPESHSNMQPNLVIYCHISFTTL